METNYNEYLRKIISFNGDNNVVALRERFTTASFFEIISKERSETTYSAFLKWLFTENGIVSESSPMAFLLDVLVKRSEEQTNVNTILHDSSVKKCFVTRKLNINSIIAETEKPVRDLAQRIEKTKGELTDDQIKKIAEKSQDRIDLYFDCDIRGSGLTANRLEIILENKIDSVEGQEKKKNATGVPEYDSKNQTTRYYRGTCYKRDDVLQLYVYLTPKDPSLVDDIDNHFIRINYQDIVDYVLLPMLASSSLSPRNRFFLEEYLHQLIFPSLDGVFMRPSIARGTEYSKQFDAVWDKHKSLIIDASIAGTETNLWRIDDTFYDDFKKLKDTIHKRLCNKKIPFTSFFLDNGWKQGTRFSKIQKFAKENGVNTEEVKLSCDSDCRDLLISFWEKNKRLLSAVIKGMKKEESFKVEVLLSTVSKRDNTHYFFDGQLCKGKSALLCAVLTYLLKNKDSDEINKNWKDYLNKCTGKVGDFPSSQQWTVNRHYDSSKTDSVKSLNKALTRVLNGMRNPKEELLYNNQAFEIAKKQPSKRNISHDYSLDIFNGKELFYYNQWGWLNIDYFIRFFRDTESGPLIELVYD